MHWECDPTPFSLNQSIPMELILQPVTTRPCLLLLEPEDLRINNCHVSFFSGDLAGQIRRKAEILRDAGFSDGEIRILMEHGVVGRFDASTHNANIDVREVRITLKDGTSIDDSLIPQEFDSLRKLLIEQSEKNPLRERQNEFQLSESQSDFIQMYAELKKSSDQSDGHGDVSDVEYTEKLKIAFEAFFRLSVDPRVDQNGLKSFIEFFSSKKINSTRSDKINTLAELSAAVSFLSKISDKQSVKIKIGADNESDASKSSVDVEIVHESGRKLLSLEILHKGDSTSVTDLTQAVNHAAEKRTAQNLGPLGGVVVVDNESQLPDSSLIVENLNNKSFDGNEAVEYFFIVNARGELLRAFKRNKVENGNLFMLKV